MRTNAHLEQNNVFVVAAIIGAHGTYLNEGFRQRDLKFLIEMFSNWMDITLRDSSLNVHNTQVMRFLNELEREGYARKQTLKGKPRYKLTRTGLLTLVSRLVNRPPQFPLEHFYFAFHIVEAYRPQIEILVQEEGLEFPPALRIELESVLNILPSLEAHIRFVETQLKKLKQRIVDSRSVIQIIDKGRKELKSTDAIVAEIAKKFPYDLNSQKPLAEFYGEMPNRIRDWVLNVTISKRTDQLWVPMENLLEAHLTSLRMLKTKIVKNS